MTNIIFFKSIKKCTVPSLSAAGYCNHIGCQWSSHCNYENCANKNQAKLRYTTALHVTPMKLYNSKKVKQQNALLVGTDRRGTNRSIGTGQPSHLYCPLFSHAQQSLVPIPWVKTAIGIDHQQGSQLTSLPRCHNSYKSEILFCKRFTSRISAPRSGSKQRTLGQLCFSSNVVPPSW